MTKIIEGMAIRTFHDLLNGWKALDAERRWTVTLHLEGQKHCTDSFSGTVFLDELEKSLGQKPSGIPTFIPCVGKSITSGELFWVMLSKEGKIMYVSSQTGETEQGSLAIELCWDDSFYCGNPDFDYYGVVYREASKPEELVKRCKDKEPFKMEF